MQAIAWLWAYACFGVAVREVGDIQSGRPRTVDIDNAAGYIFEGGPEMVFCLDADYSYFR